MVNFSSTSAKALTMVFSAVSIAMQAFVRAVYLSLCVFLDVFYEGRPIQRFWFLETVARMPYFSYIAMLHLYETLGWWRAGAELRKVHFAEEWNEMHHLSIMESLGGDQFWIDRFFAQHSAVFYYIVLCILFLFAPSLAYNFSSELGVQHQLASGGYRLSRPLSTLGLHLGPAPWSHLAALGRPFVHLGLQQPWAHRSTWAALGHPGAPGPAPGPPGSHWALTLVPRVAPGPHLVPPGVFPGSTWAAPGPHLGPPGLHLGRTLVHLGCTLAQPWPPGLHLGRTLVHLGCTWAAPWSTWAAPWSTWVAPGPHLGPPGLHLGPPGPHLGRTLVHLGCTWAAPWSTLAAPWSTWVAPGPHLGPPGLHLGCTLVHLGRTLVHLGCTWAAPWSTWVAPGLHLGPPGLHLGRTWAAPGSTWAAPGPHLGRTLVHLGRLGSIPLIYI
eukprot:gene26992-9008_t